VCPSSGEWDGTRGDGVGRDGMKNPREIKAIAGNSASCLRFSIALPTGSIPAGAGAVVVGIEGERAQLGCPCTLKLWEATGPRTVTLGNVTFPEGKAKGP
jgi:hypothetical protein